MEEKYQRYSHVTNRTYNLFDCVKILNMQQAIFYLDHHVRLMDLQISEDKNTKRPILVFLFNKDETREVYDLWCRKRGNEL